MMGGYTPGFAGTFFSVFWAIVLMVIIVTLVRWAMGKPMRWHGLSNSALAILRERYAKGEIDLKEFEERKKHLME